MTTKKEPGDVDAVLLLPAGFQQRVENGDPAALELEEMMLTRQPAELFAAEDESDRQRWAEFFSRTREADRRKKGIVEILWPQEYDKAREELDYLEDWLSRLLRDHPQEKGLTKAGVRKMIARLHEELAVYEGSQEVHS